MIFKHYVLFRIPSAEEGFSYGWCCMTQLNAIVAMPGAFCTV